MCSSFFGKRKLSNKGLPETIKWTEIMTGNRIWTLTVKNACGRRKIDLRRSICG
jgi:hypothetical protein